MSLLNELSSQVGDRSEYSNRKAAIQCGDEPARLAEIAAGLASKDTALLGDCAEVMTMVAEQHPERVARYAKQIASLLTHRTTRVRWESTHALALVASFKPKLMAGLLPQLGEMIRCDASVIVRDYAVQAIGTYAKTGPKAALAAYPYLKEALVAWGGKQAGHALNGLANVARGAPKLREELLQIGNGYMTHRRGVVRKAAKTLVAAVTEKG